VPNRDHERLEQGQRIGEFRAAGSGIVLTTHSMEEVQAVCDLIVIIDQGRILAAGTPSGLVAAHRGPGAGRSARVPAAFEVAQVGAHQHRGAGWGETPVSLDVKLKVHDPSGAAGVTIDLIRMAASALRQRRGGYPAEATPLLKSPPGTPI
jgi:ABC-type multidrug transport system ATPase subunit